VFVAPTGARAASAGVFITMAAHVAAMAPATNIGAASPVMLGGGTADKTMMKKVENDAAAFIRTIALERGRNADWAEKAVRDAATLTATAALQERVINVIAKDVADLLSQVHGRTVSTAAGETQLDTKGRSVVELKPDWKEQVMATIADPNIALILLMIGIYGILFEFWTPGVVAPGVVGGISLLVALAALSVLPVNYAGLALLLFGVGLMVAEAFHPGFGVLGLGGIVAFALGALFLFDPAQSDVPIRVSWQVVAGMTALSGIFFAGILGFAMRARRRPVRTGAEDMIGSAGEVVSWTGDEGRVLVHGEIWTARSGHALGMGQKVLVTSRTGLTLAVEPST
jgi:membrane-bound serine protease (ClpP class)